jgi:hypothetical protein
MNLANPQGVASVQMIWLSYIIESDLLALCVCASYVGIALDNTTTFEAVHRLALIDGLTGGITTGELQSRPNENLLVQSDPAIFFH